MAKKGQRCKPGCTCGLHTNKPKKCEPGCTCGRHTAVHLGPTPETAAKISATLKGKKRAPLAESTKEKISRANQGRKHTQEFSEQCRERQRARWADPSYRESTSAAIRATTQSSQNRQAASERQRELWTDQEYRDNRDYSFSGCPRGKRFTREDGVGFYLDDVGYVYLTMQHGHPLARKNGVVAEHRKVLYDSVGPGPHFCHWNCGRSIDWGGNLGIHADHLDGDVSNNTIENLVVSCYWCNRGGARLRQ